MSTYVKCRSCNLSVLFNELIMNDQNEVVCIKCYRKMKNFEDTMNKVVVQKDEKEESYESGERINYYCNSCAYKFTRRVGFTFTKCPNCGDEKLSVLNI